MQFSVVFEVAGSRCPVALEVRRLALQRSALTSLSRIKRHHALALLRAATRPHTAPRIRADAPALNLVLTVKLRIIKLGFDVIRYSRPVALEVRRLAPERSALTSRSRIKRHHALALLRAATRPHTAPRIRAYAPALNLVLTVKLRIIKLRLDVVGNRRPVALEVRRLALQRSALTSRSRIKRHHALALLRAATRPHTAPRIRADAPALNLVLTVKLREIKLGFDVIRYSRPVALEVRRLALQRSALTSRTRIKRHHALALLRAATRPHTAPRIRADAPALNLVLTVKLRIIKLRLDVVGNRRPVALEVRRLALQRSA